MVTVFFVTRSLTVNELALASMEETVPAMLRNEPETISSALTSSPARSPRAVI